MEEVEEDQEIKPFCTLSQSLIYTIALNQPTVLMFGKLYNEPVLKTIVCVSVKRLLFQTPKSI